MCSIPWRSAWPEKARLSFPLGDPGPGLVEHGGQRSFGAMVTFGEHRDLDRVARGIGGDDQRRHVLNEELWTHLVQPGIGIGSEAVDGDLARAWEQVHDHIDESRVIGRERRADHRGAHGDDGGRPLARKIEFVGPGAGDDAHRQGSRQEPAVDPCFGGRVSESP